MAYALFGTSRQLIVNPDAATCAMIAALLLPLAQGNLAHYLQLSAALAIMAGLLMVIGGMQLLMIGVMGEYIGKILSELKARPVYFVAEHSVKSAGDAEQTDDARTAAE